MGSACAPWRCGCGAAFVGAWGQLVCCPWNYQVEATGFREAVHCGGTGGGACLLRYRQRNHVLEVVVIGDTLESGIVDMYEVLGCNGRYPPEGCPAQ